MAKPLCKKGFPLFNQISELVDGTRATGKYAFRAGLSTPAPLTEKSNAAASASTSYTPVIDPALLDDSLERERNSDEEDLNTTINVPKRSFYDREMDSLISTVSGLFTTCMQMS
jgi:hypothetical protein